MIERTETLPIGANLPWPDVLEHLPFNADALLLLVDQLGPACHTGRRSCFYNAVRGNWVEIISTL
ncbi:hypothetical protein AU255_02490 [Methyloprofundus sedimenti]|uniref:phosphoribosyl-AMP cyclohydrolase n=1 Tax=Methyloprofundus sedimenti TaxID=1420851 RepID=A0A1V8M5F6_9GAMM|nr:phosphoribosyl-AMP cyclohydrolase [Methyloprofundus sedimenti]OQK16794.1 hypothetical protein AU255_02490 [Methyloprofundus sedimenti]